MLARSAASFLSFAKAGVLAALVVFPQAAAARAQTAQAGSGASSAAAGDGQAAAAPQAAPTPPVPDAVRFVWANDRPSVRLWDDAVRVDFRVRLQANVLSTELGPDDPGVFDLHRRRIGVSGSVGRVLDFQVEREVSTTKGWRDVFVDVRFAAAAQVKVGQFKLPFSMEALRSGASLDFVRRSLAAGALAPGRDVGMMFHGRYAVPSRRPRLDYALGLFLHDGDNASLGPLTLNAPAGTQVASRTTIAGRLEVSPFDRSKKTDAPKRDPDDASADGRGSAKPRPTDGAAKSAKSAGKQPKGLVESLKLGLSATGSQVPEGDNGLRGQDAFSTPFFPRIYVKGRRLRVGAEATWRVGPATVRSEVIQVRDERRGQGLAGEDLPALVATGWYVQGTWNLVRGGKNATDAGRWVGRGGVGDIELAARAERLAFGSAGTLGETESTSPRAANLAPIADTVATFGVNWRPLPLTRIQLNVVHDRIEGSPWTSRARPDSVWRVLTSFQFVF